MKKSYKEYLTSTKSLTIEKMQCIHESILREITGDVDAEEIYDELIETSTRIYK
ncbi:MAG: hypothetical protein U0L05_07655 [Schaedlerella sp.]|nr:hypothetical protein [Schaedlerella sp.]